MSDPSKSGAQQLETVVCVATHPIDLSDGRQLEPGERAEGIDVNDAHNALLVESGDVLVVTAPSSTRPSVTSSAPTSAEGA